jgi:transcriptional regulator with XRE-family HTH domain
LAFYEEETRMDMQIDSQRIRTERAKRAWSQEHLAQVTSLGLRTVQRIETSGVASNESATAIASAFEVPLSELMILAPQASGKGPLRSLLAKRLWILVAVAPVVHVVSPPRLTFLVVAIWAWLGLEVMLAMIGRRAGRPVPT